jgi:mRNA interferase MazF
MYKQGDIVLIPFPYSDLSTTKQRPVLVLSNTTYNKSQSDLVVAAITSNLISKTYSIKITDDDLDE